MLVVAIGASVVMAGAVAARDDSSCAQESAGGRIRRLLCVLVLQFTQVLRKLVGVGRRDLHSREHASVIRAVVTVVKETDVPAAADRLQGFEQRAPPLT